MVIKKYIAKDMNEVMSRIKYELGKDAVIVSQRRIRKPGIFGMFQKKVIEVTAAMDSSKPDNDHKKEEEDRLDIIQKLIEKKKTDLKQKENNSYQQMEKSKIAMLNKPEESIDKFTKEKENLLKEIKEMKEMMNSMVSNPSASLKDNKIYNILKNSDIEDGLLEYIIKEAKEKDGKLENLNIIKDIIKNSIDISEENIKGKVVIVGPTGVGKTTTIAKLAGKLALVEKKKVGLITIDTYRIGAVEQLKTYADIMNIPFKVVFSIKDMENALESMKDCEAVLIDTTGRSSKNAMQISELRAFLDKVNTDNIHLVMSCTTKNKDIASIIEGYKPLKYNNVIITKLDETTTYGSIMNILYHAKKPLSFVSTGQNVPDDIGKLNKEKIVNLITGEQSIC